MLQISMFIICGRMILHFLPRKVYEKFFRLLFAGMILLLLLKMLLQGFAGEKLWNRIKMESISSEETFGVWEEIQIEPVEVHVP